jgi:hypothetical protein
MTAEQLQRMSSLNMGKLFHLRRPEPASYLS